MQSQRVEWIDYAKGITILLVIVGHCNIPGIMRFPIFSFHMPLFFLLSAMTFRLSESAEQFLSKTEKAARHLLIPMFLMILGATIVLALQYHDEVFASFGSFHNFTKRRILAICFVSGYSVSVGKCAVPEVGIPWFFAALFAGRTLFDYLHYRLSFRALVLALTCLSAVGFIVSKFQWLPFSLDIALTILPFFLMAKLVARLVSKDGISRRGFFRWFAFWGVSVALMSLISRVPLELACRSYPVYPLCFVPAIIGTIMVGNFCVLISKVRWLTWLKTVGRYSMYLLVIHYFDSTLLCMTWTFSPDRYVQCVCRVIVDLGVFFFVLFLKESISFKKRGG